MEIEVVDQPSGEDVAQVRGDEGTGDGHWYGSGCRDREAKEQSDSVDRERPHGGAGDEPQAGGNSGHTALAYKIPDMAGPFRDGGLELGVY